MPMKVHAAAASLVLVLMVSACAAEAPTAEPEPLPTVSESASPTPEPSPEPTRPSLAELALAPGSLNFLVVGEPAPSESDPTAMIVFDPEACAEDYEISPIDRDPGRWVPAPPYVDATGSWVFRVGVSDSGVVTAIQAHGSSGLQTTKGIGIGSTVTELLAAYPTMADPIDTIATRLYVVDDGAGRLVFEVSWGGREPDYWSPRDLDRVLVMTSQAASAPAYGIWGTDGGAGSCLG